MLNYYEQGQAAFLTQDFDAAKKYYALATKQSSAEQQACSFYLLMVLYLKAGDVANGLMYFRLLEDTAFNSAQLPRDFHGVSAFNQLLMGLARMPVIEEVNLRHHVLSNEEIHALLDVILLTPIASLDLSGLPLDKTALLKIKAFIEEQDKGGENTLLGITLLGCKLSGPHFHPR